MSPDNNVDVPVVGWGKMGFLAQFKKHLVNSKGLVK